MAYSRFSEALYNQAKYWAGRWTQIANEHLWSTPSEGISKRLPIKIHTKTLRESAQRFKLLMTAKSDPNNEHIKTWGGDFAGAYEYGSGIHDTKGGGGTIRIVPRKKGIKFLVFPWDKADERIPRTEDGKVMLKAVNHQGVKPAWGGEGYMRSSADDMLRKFRKEASPALQKAIRDELYIALGSRKKR